MSEQWQWRMPFNEGGWSTSVPMDQFVRDVAWKVPPAPSYYNASEAITGQQLALLLRDTMHPLAALYVVNRPLPFSFSVPKKNESTNMEHSLPAEVTSSNSLQTFKTKLKAHHLFLASSP